MEETTIQISKATREKLSKLGRKGESYDDVINRVIFGKKGNKEVPA